VRTLTNHPHRAGAIEGVEVAPLQFTDRDALVESLRGADVLLQHVLGAVPARRCWLRRRHREHQAPGRSSGSGRRPQGGAHQREQPFADSHLDYYAGKARTEAVVRESGLPWAIVRPTLIFGPGDILINNIAWLIRRLPVFFIPGAGTYRVQPVSGDDVAEIATWVAAHDENVTVDAAGPEVLTYAELVHSIAIASSGRRASCTCPDADHPRGCRGWPLRQGCDPHAPGTAGPDGRAPRLRRANREVRTAIDDWLLRNGEQLGRAYASELDRHFRWNRRIPLLVCL